MKDELNIRTLYKPIQPTITQKSQNVAYREITPDESLSNIIYCYWELKTKDDLKNPFSYRVVADGCIDIFFELNQSSDNFVMGFSKRYTEFPLGNSFHYVGVRFLPTQFPKLFDVNAKTLSNRFESLELTSKKLSNFIRDDFSQKDDLHSTKSKFDQYFIDHIKHTPIKLDTRFQNALYVILRNYGVVNVQKELNTGLSPRQLRRYFEFYIGDTAKTFSQVVRFQNILNAKPSTQSLRQSKIFYDFGYYDQSHFIKEFKNFFGVTPSKAFGR